LKPILPKIIYENQGGFMAYKQIVDNIILVQEAIHSNKNNKEKGMNIKIDMENDFDRVSHSFLFKVPTKFGFCSSFIQWIKTCIRNPRICPLVNGRPTLFFFSNYGL
jgi:hypothetical protein